MFPRFSAMAITDVLIRPDANEPEFTGKCPAFLGRKVTNAYEEYPYAVLLEPVDAGKIGRALLLGLSRLKVSILDPEHKFAEPMVGNASGAMQSAENSVARILWKAGNTGTQWCMLQLGGAGSGDGGTEDKVFLCKVTGGKYRSRLQCPAFCRWKRQCKYRLRHSLCRRTCLEFHHSAGSWIIGHRIAIQTTGGNET